MRDVRRISDIMLLLNKIWKDDCPDMRLGQLIVNISKCKDTSELFNLEDDKMLELIDDIYINGFVNRKK